VPDGLCGDAFGAPGKAEPFGRGGLDRDTVGGHASDRGNGRAHGVGVGADLGCFADKGDVYVIDPEPLFGGKPHRVAQEDVALGPLPLRIGGREMPPDIAFGQRTVNGIGQRVQPDIGIGMALQPARVRHRDTAEHDVIARPEPVHVETGAGADIHRSPQYPFCAREIARVGDLYVIRVADRDRHRQTGGAGHRDIVGRVAFMGAMRGEDGDEIEPLRRLRGVKPGAVLRAGHITACAGPERIGHRLRGGCGGRAGLQRGNHPFDHAARHGGAGGIVDEHMARCRAVRREMVKPRARRGRAGRPAGDRLDPVGRAIHVVGMQHEHHPRGVRRERGERRVDHAAACERLPLLGHIPARADAAPGGDDDGGACHGP
jgi:hypothetical protein